MSDSSTDRVRGQQTGIEAGIKRVKGSSDDESHTTLAGTAKELFDILESTDMLLQTIDLDNLPNVIEVEELPDLVEFDRLSDAIVEHSPDLVFDLKNLKSVVNERELWNSIDLLEFGKAKRRLDRELEDVLGEDALAGVGGDSKGASDVKEYVSSLRSEAKGALAQQEATAKSKTVRDAVVKQHVALERIYASNKARFRTSNDRQIPRNPTAVSLLPPGPLPDSVSARLSTVPSGVPHAKMRPLPRIYGRRWRRVGSKR